MPNYKAAFESASLDLSAIMSLLGFTSYPGVDQVLRAITELILNKAEAQALRDQVKALQSDANSYQSGYDEGRRMGTKHRQDEVEQLTREVEALRARVAELEAEVEDADGLSKRLGELLSEITIIIRGPEPELTRWGYSDLPLRVKAVVEEVAALRRFAGEIYQVLGALDAPENVLDNASDAANGDKLRHKTLLPFAALRARVVVVPERKNRATTIAGLSYDRGWNYCLDELARLNGQTVSERLLRTLVGHATGEIKHLNNGLCPDDLEGHDTRDPDCVVCRVLLDEGKQGGGHA